MTGIELIAAERWRQVEEKGYSAEHDAKHTGLELAWAAAHFAAPRRPYIIHSCASGGFEVMPCFPGLWHPRKDTKAKHTRIELLAIAGALVAAEIDRLQNKKGVA